MFKFITTKPLWANILAAIGLVLLLILLFFGSLDWITGFGKSEKVPGVVGQNASAAQKILEDKGFHVALQDSVYVDSIAKLAVVKQSPEPDAIVKKGRTIYLTINRSIPPMVEMPNLIGFSIRSAEMYLQSLGLKLGIINYKPDIARNAVLEQSIKDVAVKAGTKISLGTAVDLVLGSGVGGGEMEVPNLIGLTVNESKSWLSSLSLNFGSVIPVGAITDTGAAFVVKQNPEPYVEPTPGQKSANKIRSGQLLDIYISAVAPVKDSLSKPVNQ
ncbi:MAG: PASTA domain-containing protein [Chitinophagaceae bacterium]|nr:PASTA domain-containing protein [Chitinophagaceae bacterium]